MHRVFDAHSDLLSELLKDAVDGFSTGRGDGAYKHYDLPRIRAGGVRALVLALFTADDRGEHPVVRTLRMIDMAERLVARHPEELALARSGPEIDRAVASGKTAVLLSIENGVACLDRLELLNTYYRLGVRAMGLVWNGRNAIADGVAEEGASGRLTAFGRSVVDEMARLGMVVDVSHLSRAGFWDVVERLGERPFIASHSNARDLCDHRRNLDADQLRAIGRARGVVGVNFYSAFLRADGARATIEDVVRHVHALIEKTGGVEHIGIGSDFDGIPEGPRGLEDPGTFPELARALEGSGLASEDVERIMFGNFLRVFREVCG